MKEFCLRLGILNEQLPDLFFSVLNNLLGFFFQRLPADINTVRLVHSLSRTGNIDGV